MHISEFANPTSNTENKKEVYDYDYFNGPFQRKQIFEFTERVVDFLDTLDNTPNILFLDRAARPAYAAIDEYWNLKHGNGAVDIKEKPGFYFINPRASLDFEMGYNENLKIIKEFDENFGHLDKNRTIILLDTCMHTGKNIKGIKKVLEYLGFKDIRVIAADTNRNSSGLDSETETIKNIGVCDVFGHDNDLIDWDDTSIISRKKPHASEPGKKFTQYNSKLIRTELRQIIRDNYR